MIRNKLFNLGLAVFAAAAVLLGAVIPAQAADQKPNIRHFH